MRESKASSMNHSLLAEKVEHVQLVGELLATQRVGIYTGKYMVQSYLQRFTRQCKPGLSIRNKYQNIFESSLNFFATFFITSPTFTIIVLQNLSLFS